MMGRTGLAFAALALLLGACGEEVNEERVPFDILVATLGPEGGEVVGEAGSQVEGVALSVPAGALAEDVTVEIKRVMDGTPLPENAFSIGRQFQVSGDGALAGVGQLTVPFDPEQMRQFIDDIQGVKVWRRSGEGWVLAEVVGAEDSRVTVTLDALATHGAGVRVEED